MTVLKASDLVHSSLTTTALATITMKKITIKKPVKKALTGPALAEARDRLHELKDIQNTAREEELQIREYLAKHLHDADEGAKTHTIDGIKVTVTRSLRREIGVEEAERLTKEHGELSLQVLRWKPEVRVGEYKKHTGILDEYIVTKPSPPTVEFK